MKAFNVYFHKYKHFLWLSYYLFILLGFQYCEKVVEPKYYMFTPLDNYIPFMKGFLIPYLGWYLYIVVPLLYLGFTDEKEYYRLCIFMFGGMTIAYIIFLLFPNGQNLRPVITDTDFFARSIAAIYKMDTPTNVTPSIHVLNAMAVHIALCNSSALQKKSWIRRSSFLCMLSICASTVFIKQHSVLDVFWGGVLVLCLYAFIYKLPNRSSLKWNLLKGENSPETP